MKIEERYLDGKHDTIIACSTSMESNAALAVLRISGSFSLETLRPFFSTSQTILPQRVVVTDLCFQGQQIDHVVLTFFQSPRSYTGENMLELSIHGNRRHIHSVIELFVRHAGFRMALPGEFTWRALHNGKLSLSQVEGLDLVLNAQSDWAIRQGQSLLRGELHSTYLRLRDEFLSLKTAFELALDFSDDVGDDHARQELERSLRTFQTSVYALFQRTRGNRASLLHPTILIMGRPNAGKSLLFNRLLGFARSIVSSTPGTTRDYVSEVLTIGSVDFRLVDSAGLRESDDAIESEGVARSLSLAKTAFFKIEVINPFDEGPSTLDGDAIIYSHADLPGFSEARAHFSVQGFHCDLVNPSIRFDALFNQISSRYESIADPSAIALPRHVQVIETLHRQIDHFVDRALHERDFGVLSFELSVLSKSVDELVGTTPVDDVLNNVFDHFCIGK